MSEKNKIPVVEVDRNTLDSRINVYDTKEGNRLLTKAIRKLKNSLDVKQNQFEVALNVLSHFHSLITLANNFLVKQGLFQDFQVYAKKLIGDENFRDDMALFQFIGDELDKASIYFG